MKRVERNFRGLWTSCEASSVSHEAVEGVFEEKELRAEENGRWRRPSFSWDRDGGREGKANSCCSHLNSSVVVHK